MKNIYIFFLISLTIACSENDKKKSSDSDVKFNYLNISNYFGEWMIYDFRKVGGGMLNEEESKSLIGQKIVFSNDYYEFRGEIETNIYYEYEEFKNEQDEGVIGDKKISTFYAFKMDREKIKLLKIMRNKKKYTHYEIYNQNELIKVYDGKIFSIQRIK